MKVAISYTAAIAAVLLAGFCSSELSAQQTINSTASTPAQSNVVFLSNDGRNVEITFKGVFNFSTIGGSQEPYSGTFVFNTATPPSSTPVTPNFTAAFYDLNVSSFVIFGKSFTPTNVSLLIQNGNGTISDFFTLQVSFFDANTPHIPGTSQALRAIGLNASPPATMFSSTAFPTNLDIFAGLTRAPNQFASVEATATATNVRPIADAGADQTVPVGAEVRLDGGGSRDANGDPLTFSWRLLSIPSGSRALVVNSSSIRSSFIPDVAGAYVAQLIVNDRYINSLADTATITATSSAIVGLPSATFTLPDRASISLRTAGTGPTSIVGYARIQPDTGSIGPAGMAIFGSQQNGVLVTEAAVPASPLMRSARIYAEIGTRVNTGLALANPNNEPASVTFFFTNSSGNFGNGTLTIPANGQMAAFLNQAPFNATGALVGSLTLNSTVPIGVTALRGLTNERGEFLITTLPVADLIVAPTAGSLVFPHFATGGGWTTEIVLVNTTDTNVTGTVAFTGQSGNPAVVLVNQQSNATVPYSIAPRTSQKFLVGTALTTTLTGSVRVIPSSGTMAPFGQAIFAFRNGAVTVAEAGVPAAPAGTAFRLYAETAGSIGAVGSIRTGIAVVNTTSTTANVTAMLYRVDGSSTGLQGTLSIPANAQVALFLDQINGLAQVQAGFQGVLRLTSPALISVTGLRGRSNERGDFLVTTIPAADESAASTADVTLFPHIVHSGGYTTQFVLYSRSAGQISTGELRFFSQPGTPLALPLGTATAPPPPSSVSLAEGWESAAIGTYRPVGNGATLIRGDAGTWVLGDTISNFPSCGTTSNFAEIFVQGNRKVLRLQSAATSSDCADNLDLGLLPELNPGFAVPIRPETALRFEIVSLTGTVRLDLLDNLGNVSSAQFNSAGISQVSLRPRLVGQTLVAVQLTVQSGAGVVVDDIQIIP